jgi:hypothetical protein
MDTETRPEVLTRYFQRSIDSVLIRYWFYRLGLGWLGLGLIKLGIWFGVQATPGLN